MFSIPKNSQALFKDIGLVFQKLTFLDFTLSQYNNIAVFGFWLVSEVTQIYETFNDMWCFVRFDIICTILKTWKTSKEECYF